MERHEKSALAVAGWLRERAEVARVLHPAFPDDPGHAIWKRDFGRSNGLFGFVLRGRPSRRHTPFSTRWSSSASAISWGGFESLAVLAELEHVAKRPSLDRGSGDPPPCRAGGSAGSDRGSGARLRRDGNSRGMKQVSEALHRIRARYPELRSISRDLTLRTFNAARAEFALLATIFVVVTGLWAFVSLADEIVEGETEALDRAVLLFFRNAGDPSDPSVRCGSRKPSATSRHSAEILS